MLPDRKEKEISVCSKKLRLAERDAIDVKVTFKLFKNRNLNEVSTAIDFSLLVVHQSLRINYKDISKWNIFRRYKLYKLIGMKNLSSEFSTKQILEFARDVQIMDGLMVEDKPIDNDGDKKKVQ